MQAVILAAGQGKRMGELGRARSKAMMPVLGVPLIARVMQTLAENSIDEFILVINPKDLELTSYLTENTQNHGHVAWVEQAEPLGMAHALSCAAPKIQDSFILTACDNLLVSGDIGRMLDFWRQSVDLGGLLGLMRVAPEAVVRSAMVVMDGGSIHRIIEKPSPAEIVSNVASLPFYLFRTEILTYLPRVNRSSRGEYELQDAIQLMIDAGSNVSGVFFQSRMTLTHPVDLIAMNNHYMVGMASAPPRLQRQAVLKPPYYIEDGVEIGPSCVIGPQVYIESGCRVGEGVRVSDAVLLGSARVPDGVEINRQVWG